MTAVTLNELCDKAAAWLLRQPVDRALCPCEANYFREHLCLPQWLVEAIQRDAEKEAKR